MGGLFNKILTLFLVLVALVVVAAIAFVVLFDPNDFRDDIAAEVQRTTGRELVIEGDLELSLFPWLAINVGRTTLGNAQGFGDEPFLSFDEARLSVRVLPMLLRREVSVGTAALESFELNLAVAPDGRSNWQDLLEPGEAEPVIVEDDAAGEPAAIDIARIEIGNAVIDYNDAQLGERYRLTNFNVRSGRVTGDAPIRLESDFDFELQPADLAGDIEIELEMLLDGDAGTVDFSGIEMTVLGVDVSADVEPFSYVDEAVPTARVSVAAFSLKSLMERMNIEPPVTADPDALGKVYGDAVVRVAPEAITMKELTFIVDDTSFNGELSLAADAAGTISIDLAADSIDLGRYMAPAEEGASTSGESVPVEIPTELINAFNVRGSLTVEEALLSGMTFENVELGLKVVDGVLRLHPVAADLFGGEYSGDVQINAAGDVPALSVDENVSNVSLGSLALAMFDQENITGAINGAFKLRGRGEDLAAIQRSLDGSMSMELLDGTFEGTDVWYEIRRARALFKQEPAPEPELPPRTRFSNVKVTGPVTDGVFRSDDLFAELPFMQLTGSGSVDFAAAEIDYRMTARVIDQPEFAEGATEEELEEFTEAVIPLKITGSLASPKIAPDIGKMLKDEAEQEIKKRLFDELLGGDDDAEGETEADAEAEATKKKKKKKDKDKLKDLLKDLVDD